jgi:hypothetical protein
VRVWSAGHLPPSVGRIIAPHNQRDVPPANDLRLPISIVSGSSGTSSLNAIDRFVRRTPPDRMIAAFNSRAYLRSPMESHLNPACEPNTIRGS